MQRPDSPAAPNEETPKRDKNYRRYASNVERALSLFDTALQEWADYIAFLGRLLKALQSRPANTIDIPHKVTVAKRLAQCLAPALPSGVHQKTLDVYAYVFSVLGKDGLSKDLPLWLPGISPTLSSASLSVKPILLSLYETFIVPLNPEILRPALKGILLALLPGLEEESSEEFERTFTLINRFRDAISQDLYANSASEYQGDQYLWQSVFLVSITSPSRRQGVLAYLSRELPNLGRPAGLDQIHDGERSNGANELGPEISAVTSPEPGLLIRCFVAGLQDEQLLIQRGFLDLLVTNLPLHSTVFRHRVVSKDLELLIVAAASVVARREMSLNRRLWTWFLGPNSSQEVEDTNQPSVSPGFSQKSLTSNGHHLSQTQYFERYGLEALVNGILKMTMDDSSISSERTRPFRICLSLMDRGEIGGLVIPRVFLPAMENVWKYEKGTASKDAFAEVLRSATAFFDGVEGSLIWAQLTRVLIKASEVYDINVKEGPGLNSSELFDLVYFIVTKFNIQEDDMLTVHIPLSSLALIVCIRSKLDLLVAPESQNQQRPPYDQAFNIASHLIDLIPQQSLPSGTLIQGVNAGSSRHFLAAIQEFYERVSSGSEDMTLPLQSHRIWQTLSENASQIVIDTIICTPIQTVNLEKSTKLLDKILRKSQEIDHHAYEGLISSLVTLIQKPTTERHTLAFPIIGAVVSLLEAINCASNHKTWGLDHRVRSLLSMLLGTLWFHLSPSRPRYNVEAVRCFWRIHSISPDAQLVEASVSSFLFLGEHGVSSRNIDIEGARRFTTLWAHSLSGPYPSKDRHSLNGKVVSRSGKNINGSVNDHSVLARPLLLLLDLLSDPKTQTSMFISRWLHSLTSPQRIIDIVITRLDASVRLACLEIPNAEIQDEAGENTDGASPDVEECLYYLQTISNLTSSSTESIWTSMVPYSGISADTDPSTAPNLLHDGASDSPLYRYIAINCLSILQCHKEERSRLSSLRQTAAKVLQQLSISPTANDLSEMDIEISLLNTLSWAIGSGDLMLQVLLMDLLSTIFSFQTSKQETLSVSHRTQASMEAMRSVSQLSIATEQPSKEATTIFPSKLIDCLILGVSSPESRPVLEYWISFVGKCLPLYASNTFQTLMPLVECFIKTVGRAFQHVQDLFPDPASRLNGYEEPIVIINSLFNGLEHCLAGGHDQLMQDEGHSAATKTPEQSQGFFGNMVSGVFSAEAQRSRTTTANNRLTVLLCFKDAVRVAFSMWLWGDTESGRTSGDLAASASFNYISLRLKNRTRRMLEHLFAVEALECLETLVEFWHEGRLAKDLQKTNTVINLLHALKGSRPKNTVPAIFNAIYSRTNPQVLDPVRKSTLTSELSDTSLATFLTAYTRSMEDDALDEIWTDCMTFLRDVLGNPLPHRQTLPILLEFTAVLGGKIDNTNFGEQRKMRREIGELFVRILAATFTIKPLSFHTEAAPALNGNMDDFRPDRLPEVQYNPESDEVVARIASILPHIAKVLIDTDRIAAAAATISSQVLLPTIRWKTFPQNVTISTLNVLKTLSKIPDASKTSKRDMAEAFNDPKFFNDASIDLIEDGWIPLMRQWALLDKDRLPEILSRLPSPSSAGIMFGVGASSARLEADRKAQLNLRRIAFLVLSADQDSFVTNLHALQEKLVDMMTASVASSPSSVTRTDIFMVLRSLLLKITPVHLTSLWPIISSELHETLSSINPKTGREDYNATCTLQAAKFLDTLLLLAPDDFQLREWLFITDTIDAVYRPLDWRPTALVDSLAEEFETEVGVPYTATSPTLSSRQGRRPLITWEATRGIPKEELTHRVLRPFLNQLSINSYESTYRMEVADRNTCCKDLLKDLFDSATLV